MRDDDLLHRLGGLAREEEEREDEVLDERWDALARGELTPAEEDELRREDPEAYDMFRPLDESFRSRVAERVRARTPGSRSNVLPFTRRGTTWGWLVAASGLAAVLALLVLLPSAPTSLPGYVLSVEGGARTLRSDGPRPSDADDDAMRVLRSGDRLEVLLRPATAVEGDVEAGAWLFTEGSAEPRDVTDFLQVADSGAVRLVGTVGQDLAWPPGRLDLWIAVGRPGRIPRPEGRQSEPREGLWRIPLQVAP